MKRFISLICLVFLAVFWRGGVADVGHGGGGHYDNAITDAHHIERGEEGRHSVHALDAHTHAEQHKKEHDFEDDYGNRDHVMDSSGRKAGLLKAFDAHSAYGRHLVKDKYFGEQDHGSHYGGAFKGEHGGVGGLGHGHEYGPDFRFGPGHGLGHHSFGDRMYGHGDGFGHSGFGGAGSNGLGHTVFGRVLLGHEPYGHY